MLLCNVCDGGMIADCVGLRSETHSQCCGSDDKFLHVINALIVVCKWDRCKNIKKKEWESAKTFIFV